MSQANRTPGRTPWPRGRALLVVVVVGASVLAYAPAYHFEYAQDAAYLVERNPVVQRGTLGQILGSHYWAGVDVAARTLYRPVTILSYALERRATGAPHSGLSHLINVALHDLAALLLFVYVRRIGGSAAAATTAALLFAVHPLLLQGVVNVVGRADLLATVFSLASLIALSAAGRWRGGEPPSPAHHRLAAWGGAVLLFLALGAKEIAVATPVLILSQEVHFRLPFREAGRQWWICRAATLAPCGLAIVLYVVLRTRAIGSFVGLQEIHDFDNVLLGAAGVSRWATALAMAGRYLGLLVYPRALSADYSGSAIPIETSLLAPLPLAGAALLLVLVVLALRPVLAGSASTAGQAGAGSRVTAMGAAIFLFPYLVIGNLLAFNAAGFAERLIYFSAAGFCILLGFLLARVYGRWGSTTARRGMAVGLFAAVCLLATLHTRRVAPMWRDRETLFIESLEATPDSLRARFGLAGIRRAQGRTEEALALYSEALRSWPGHGPSWLDRGIVLAVRNDLLGAEQSLRRAIEIRPDIGEAQMNLGMVLRRTGRLGEAERALRKAVLLEPGHPKACAELAHLLYQTARFDQAVLRYERCVALGREDLRRNLELARARRDGRTP